MRAAIERDDFASPEVKKLTGHPLHRAKLDYDSRLLLQFVEYGGRKACLALELIERHAYDRPMVLVGCAGSGKTALTLIKLRELSGEVLYVTQSA